MDFRRSGPLDERRRRVLMDEIATPADDDDSAAPTPGSSAKGPVRAYSPAVLADRQPKVTDLLPVRPLMVALFVLLGLTGVAAIETIHIHAATNPLGEGAARFAAFDISERGSLITWYSSALLAGAALLSLIVFGIRAHRVDDYRGRYRIWLWVAAALLYLSLDAGAGLHDALGFALQSALGPRFIGSDSPTARALAWTVLYSIVFGALWLRLAFEIWSSLTGLAALATSGLLYLACAMLQLGVLRFADPLLAAVASSSAAMLAHLLLMISVGLYGRHVYLDAQGRLKVFINPDKRSAKSKSRTKLKVLKSEQSATPDTKSSSAAARPATASTSKPGEPIRFGGSSDKAGAALSKAALSSPMADDDEDDDEDEDGYGDQRLSKSERRRLKKLARRGGPERRAA